MEVAIGPTPLPPASPPLMMRQIVFEQPIEWAIQTLKHECERLRGGLRETLNRITREFQRWYNHERGHTARDHLPPACDQKPDPVQSLKPGDIVCTTRLGGHLKAYSRRAA